MLNAIARQLDPIQRAANRCVDLQAMIFSCQIEADNARYNARLSALEASKHEAHSDPVSAAHARKARKMQDYFVERYQTATKRIEMLNIKLERSLAKVGPLHRF